MDISASTTNDQVVFRVRNSVPQHFIKSKGGIGLENLSRRLELLYPGKHELNLQKNESEFIATLKIAVSH